MHIDVPDTITNFNIKSHLKVLDFDVRFYKNLKQMFEDETVANPSIVDYQTCLIRLNKAIENYNEYYSKNVQELL